jgi:5-methylcytosine-specific restriction endonuclease McrA
MYSSLKRPTCKCGCGNPPTISMKGFNYNCAPEEVKSKFKSKRDLQQKKANAAKYASTKLRMDSYKEGNELDIWFKDRREQMLGYCTECSRGTNKGDDKYFKWSICHIAPKGLCPSVSTNYHNWIELCQDCHNEFDSTFEKASKMKCFHEAKTKFQIFRHLLPPDELRKVNTYLL